MLPSEKDSLLLTVDFQYSDIIAIRFQEETKSNSEKS